MVDGTLKKLPEDVSIYIVLMFPVKSVMRLRCISRNFYILIQSSTFINLHLYQTTCSEAKYIILKRSLKDGANRYKTRLSLLHSDDNDCLNPIFQDLDVTNLMSTYSFDQDQLIGPCHGLIALMDSRRAIVFNPCTRNYKLLQISPFSCPPGFFCPTTGVGFGYDSIVNDYKVVRNTIIYKVDELEYLEESERKLEVYDLSIDAWRELDHIGQQLATFCWVDGTQMFYKGACHWIACQGMDTHIILCFDMTTEIFRSIKIPEACHIINGPCCKLFIIDESLTLIYYPYPEPQIVLEKDFLDIWIMKEYSIYDSWIKKHIIRFLPIESPLTIWKGKFLVFENKSGCLMSCDLNSNEIKEFNLHGYPKSFRSTIYTDSLTSIPRGNEQTTAVQNF